MCESLSFLRFNDFLRDVQPLRRDVIAPGMSSLIGTDKVRLSWKELREHLLYDRNTKNEISY
jgi:hypothetical protein